MHQCITCTHHKYMHICISVAAVQCLRKMFVLQIYIIPIYLICCRHSLYVGRYFICTAKRMYSMYIKTPNVMQHFIRHIQQKNKNIIYFLIYIYISYMYVHLYININSATNKFSIKIKKSY